MGEEVDRGAGDDRRDLPRGQLLRRMRDHQLVADGGDDHAGHHHDVQVGVGVARERRALAPRQRQPPLGDPRDVVEVEPPHRGAAEERDRERGEPGGVQVELGRRRAGDHDRLAEGDDDEELEALGEVRHLDVPALAAEVPPSGDPERGERRAVVDEERRDPQQRARGPVGQAAGDPEHARGDEPHEDRAGALALDRAAVRGREREEQVASDLDRDVRAREQQRPVAERLGDRDRHHEAREHQPDQQEPHDDRVGVELVGDPRRVVPRPPDREQRDERLPDALPGEVLEQEMRDLRDREDEDQVVEQLERRRPLLLSRRAREAAHPSRSNASRRRGGSGTGRRVSRPTNTCTNQPVAAGSSSPALNTASS